MSPTRHASSLVAILAIAATILTGCGAEDEEMGGAQYPQQAIGYDGAEAPRQAAAASLVANPPAPPVEDGAVRGEGQEVAIGVDNNDSYADTDPSALTEFKPALDPYGTWVDDGQYGTVWVPSTSVVGEDFQPYVTNGHWAYENDYVWVSNYEWGWAPFHYGRWVHRDVGWGWIPGRTYAGAWVSWRTGYDGWGYVGWAPLAPSWYWRSGYAYSLYFAPSSPYVYCGYRDVFHPVVATRVVAGGQAAVIAGHTQPYVRAQPAVAGGGGRVPASPRVGGPPPGQLGIAANQVARAPASNVGLAHAQQLARPSTAFAAGARAPIGASSMAAGSRPLPSSLAPVASSPRYINPSTGAQFRAPTPRPSVQNFSRPTPVPSPSYSSHYGGASTPSYSSHPSSYGSFSSPHSTFGATPSYGSHPSAVAQPTYHTPQPTFHSAAPSSFGGGHVGGGSVGHFGGGGSRGGHR